MVVHNLHRRARHLTLGPVAGAGARFSLSVSDDEPWVSATTTVSAHSLTVEQRYSIGIDSDVHRLSIAVRVAADWKGNSTLSVSCGGPLHRAHPESWAFEPRTTSQSVAKGGGWPLAWDIVSGIESNAQQVSTGRLSVSSSGQAYPAEQVCGGKHGPKGRLSGLVWAFMFTKKHYQTRSLLAR